METIFLGTIIPWAGNFAPKDFMFCHGQSLPITQYTALYSLLGTRYGGNGSTTFNLPNLQGQILMGAGAGIEVGSKSGAETTTLTADNIPAHNHAFMASEVLGNNQAPAGAYLAKTGLTDRDYVENGTVSPLAANAISPAGSPTPAPFSVRQPSVTLHFIICVSGASNYPPRP
jgi:microcystin-dependent protein